ncbi:MAG TPA: S-layer homology domain-containing protein [Thermoanaerobaculia bacterium]|nr:S-layer homology domain-containing protein [Thermoanaerobaculia bacterium]
MSSLRQGRRVFGLILSLALAALTGAGAMLGNCGPFTDVAADVFCPFVLEIFYLGITTGTTATTYDPAGNVTRLQMAAFLSRSVDGVLRRGGRRAVLDRFWTPSNTLVVGLTSLGTTPGLVRFDGADLWVPVTSASAVARVRASDGRVLETWTGAGSGYGVVAAMGRILVSGASSPGALYRIDPGAPAGAVTTVASNLGASARGLTFDGGRFWTANAFGGVSIIAPAPIIPWTVNTVTTGFNGPVGALFDGADVWVTDFNAGKLLKLGVTGAISLTVTVGSGAEHAVFDGANIWVPNANDASVTVVRASNGAILATLTGNGLFTPHVAAFDGERTAVTNGSGASISLWKAADLTSLGAFGVGPAPFGACSDGIFFWITLEAPGGLARF